MVREMTDNKTFTKVFANDNSVIFFCPLSPSYFKPALVPSTGKTQITFFGNGFVHTGEETVRFTLEEDKVEIPIEFDDKTNTFYCQTPVFEKINKKYGYPLSCKVEISLDKKQFFAYHRPLLIYCNNHVIQLRSYKFRVFSLTVVQSWVVVLSNSTCLSNPKYQNTWII